MSTMLTAIFYVRVMNYAEWDLPFDPLFGAAPHAEMRTLFELH